MSTQNEIYFPRTIPAVFLKRKFTWKSDVNGGAVSIADLNIKQQSFMGGNVTRLGWITELGLYACPSLYNEEILALYVHDPLKVTEEGKELVKAAFPNDRVIFDVYKEVGFTEAERKQLNKDKAFALKAGLPPDIVDRASSEELLSLIAARKSGVSDRPGVVVVSERIEPSELNPQYENLGIVGKPPILAGKMQPKSRKPVRR